MEQTYREQLMDMACHILMKGAEHLMLPVKGLEYDTDEAGQIEWVHIIYFSGQVDHLDITGTEVPEAFELVWEKIRPNMRPSPPASRHLSP